MPNYQNGTIYKICCKNPEITDCYVGSTTSHLKRKSRHKGACNNKDDKAFNYPVYRFIRDNGNWENWEMVLLEDYPCRNKKQLVIRERFWFEKLNSTLNSQYPERSKKESDTAYYLKNREKLLEYQKKYTKENKDKKRIYDKKYTEENKDKISEKNKEYYIKNKEEMKDKMRESYIKNKDKRQLYNKQIINCPCGSVVCRGGLSQHKKSKKHQNWEKTQVE